MNAADLPPRERRAAHLAACWAAVKQRPDPWRRAWEDMGHPGRRALLTLAGMSHTHCWQKWDEFTDETRQVLVISAEKMRDILGRILPATEAA